MNRKLHTTSKKRKDNFEIQPGLPCTTAQVRITQCGNYRILLVKEIIRVGKTGAAVWSVYDLVHGGSSVMDELFIKQYFPLSFIEDVTKTGAE